MKMKIGIVVPFFTPFVKGNEYQLASYLVRAGHEVHIITSSAKAPREYLESGYNLECPFQVRYVKTIAVIKENPIVTSLRRYVDTGYDVLLLQEDYPFICHLAFHLAKRNLIPTILSSERYYYPRDPFKRVPLRLLDKTLNRGLWKGCNLITTHSTAAKAFLTAIGAEESKIEVIPIGVDAEAFTPVTDASFRKKHGAAGKTLILSVARLHPYKGLSYLIQAMERVIRENRDVQLVILGRGPEESSLSKLVAALNLKDFVTIDTDVVPHEMMPAVYASADIYVQPSIIEPFGTSVLEAMACGKAVVSTPVGGILDTVVDGQIGFLVPPGDVLSLAHRLSYLTSDPGLREELGKRARERVLSKFDWMIVSRQYEDAIKSIVS